MKRVQRRFGELDAMAAQIAQSMKTGTKSVQVGIEFSMRPATGTYKPVTTYEIDWPLLVQWSSSVEGLLLQVFGRDHPHYKNFKHKSLSSSHSHFRHVRAVFDAAKDDYEGGYIFDVRSLVHAKVFADEIEQAEELLKNGYKTAAAVVAGVVLETTLRELCEQNGIDIAKLNRMNADLAGAGIYNNARQDQVQAWSKIRNHAAHGEPDEFNVTEVSNMIVGVRDFVANQIT